MNERIKELMLEAGFAAPELAGRTNKFAELLVRECAMHMDEYADRTGDDILKHFGMGKENEQI